MRGLLLRIEIAGLLRIGDKLVGIAVGGNIVVFVFNEEFRVLFKLFFKVHGAYGRILGADVLRLMRKCKKLYVALLYALGGNGQMHLDHLAGNERIVVYAY